MPTEFIYMLYVVLTLNTCCFVVPHLGIVTGLCKEDRILFVLDRSSSIEVNNIESPTRCNSNYLLISKISSTCFGQLFAHLQERKTEIYSMWYSVASSWTFYIIYLRQIVFTVRYGLNVQKCISTNLGTESYDKWWRPLVEMLVHRDISVTVW